MNGAILLLLLIGAPNFRPRFRYFNKWTASIGLLVPLVAMFGIDERLTLIFIGACCFHNVEQGRGCWLLQ